MIIEIKQVPLPPLGPSGLPNDLERFRPVEREEVTNLHGLRHLTLKLCQIFIH